MCLTLSGYTSCQDQTVDGINHLCEFTRKMEPSQNANVRQASHIYGLCYSLLWHMQHAACVIRKVLCIPPLVLCSEEAFWVSGLFVIHSCSFGFLFGANCWEGKESYLPCSALFLVRALSGSLVDCVLLPHTNRLAVCLD